MDRLSKRRIFVATSLLWFASSQTSSLPITLQHGLLMKAQSGGGGADVTPNAINFGTGAENPGGGQTSLPTSQITISGISTTINLEVDYPGGTCGTGLYCSLDLMVDGMQSAMSEGGSNPINAVTNGTTIQIIVNYMLNGMTWGPSTITLKNASDANAVLGTFRVCQGSAC